MRLVGATETVIRLPLLLQGMAQGLLGAAARARRARRRLYARRCRASSPCSPLTLGLEPRRVPVAPPQMAAAPRGRGHAGRARRAARQGAGRAIVMRVPCGAGGPGAARGAAPRGPRPARPGAARGAEIGESERTLQQKQSQLNEERAKVARGPRKREAAILAELEDIDKRLAEKRRQVAVLDAPGQEGPVRRSRGCRGRSDGSRSRRSGQEEALGRRLRALYKLQVAGGRVARRFCRGRTRVDQAMQPPPPHDAGHGGRPGDSRVSCTSEGLADRQDPRSRRGASSWPRSGVEAEQSAPRPIARRRKRRALLAKVRGRAGLPRPDGRASCPRPPAVSRPSSGTCRRSSDARRRGPRRRRRVRPRASPGTRAWLAGCAAACRGRRTARWSASTARRCTRASERRRSGTGSTSRWPRGRTSRPCTPAMWSIRAGSVATAT